MADPDLASAARNLAMSEPFMVIGSSLASAGQHVQDAWDTIKAHVSNLADKVTPTVQASAPAQAAAPATAPPVAPASQAQKYRVKLSDGSEFDVTTDGQPPSEEAVMAFLKANPSAAKAGADSTPAPPAGLGVMASAFQNAKDVGMGMAKGGMHTAIDAGQLVAPVLRQIPGVRNYVATPDQFQQAREATAYTNNLQRAGGAAETLGELAIPVTKGATAAAELIPTTAKAGAKFQAVMGAARNMPVDVSKVGDAALRVAELAQHGGGTQWGPAPVRQLIQYMTNPQNPGLTYEVGREFASNISRLSAKDWAAMNPTIGREVANLRVTLNQALGQAASAAGKGQEYAQAMTDFARAKQIRAVYDAVLEGAKRGAPYATAAGIGTYLTKKLTDLLGN